jgi:hypothetical protein
MAARNARRKAKKEELRRAQAAATDEPPVAAAAPAPAVAPPGTSFSALTADAPAETGGTSFEDLMAGQDAAPTTVRADEAAAEEEQTHEVHGLAPAEDEERVWGAEGPPAEGSSRLVLPVVDDTRPILTSSGYHGPSRAAWIAAFALFGLAAGIFWTVSPAFRDLLLPADLAKPEFVSNATPVAGDTNALRDAGNIKQFDIFAQAPIFFVAWAVVGAYVVGFVLILISLVRSLTSSYFAKRRKKKADEFAEKYGQPYPE